MLDNNRIGRTEPALMRKLLAMKLRQRV